MFCKDCRYKRFCVAVVVVFWVLFLLSFFFQSSLWFGLLLGLGSEFVLVVFPRSKIFFFMRTTIECCSKWHRLLQMAVTVSEMQNCVGVQKKPNERKFEGQNRHFSSCTDPQVSLAKVFPNTHNNNEIKAIMEIRPHKIKQNQIKSNVSLSSRPNRNWLHQSLFNRYFPPFL